MHTAPPSSHFGPYHVPSTKVLEAGDPHILYSHLGARPSRRVSTRRAPDASLSKPAPPLHALSPRIFSIVLAGGLARARGVWPPLGTPLYREDRRGVPAPPCCYYGAPYVVGDPLFFYQARAAYVVVRSQQTAQTTIITPRHREAGGRSRDVARPRAIRIFKLRCGIRACKKLSKRRSTDECIHARRQRGRRGLRHHRCFGAHRMDGAIDDASVEAACEPDPCRDAGR
jgi:hypothetical protein